MASRKCAQAGRQNGYALVAAMLIMIMITALGVVAMVTSSSEQRITSNLGESQMMFYHAEQAVDRILSHLTYLQGGMFSVVNGLGYDPAQSGNILSPKQVLSSKSVLYKSSAGTLDPSALYKIDAWFDPLDFNSPLANTISFWSRPAAITVRVTDSRSGSQRAFRFYVQPRSPWDFAYYVQNNVPADRKTSSLAGENCGATSPNWYSCQTALMTRDQVTGDAYVGNVVMTPAGVTEAFPDTGTLFVRGWPVFAGEARWRSPVPFDEGTFNGAAFVNSLNQTRGGSATSYQPKGKGGMKAYSKPVTMPNIGQTFTDYYNSADYVFDDPTQGGCVGCVWKILFRNDLDTHNDVAGGFPNRGNSRVASAYTGSVLQRRRPKRRTDEAMGRVLRRFHDAARCADDPLRRGARSKRRPGGCAHLRGEHQVLVHAAKSGGNVHLCALRPGGYRPLV